MRVAYYVGGRRHMVTVRPQAVAPARPSLPGLPPFAGSPRAGTPAPSRRAATGAEPALASDGRGSVRVRRPEQTLLPTETLAVTGARTGEIARLRRRYGLEVVAEGSHGKVLLGATSSDDPFAVAVQASLDAVERGVVRTAQPNFLRLLQRPGRSGQEAMEQWGLANRGAPGVVGADVAARAAWTITRGRPEVRVAVLDDGVECGHPYLAPAVVAQRDFVQQDLVAGPAGDDTHGTACAGIVASRDDVVRGLAPEVSLVACRIAERRPEGWLVDDYHVADAIDWCWEEAEADVLSLSWAAGAPSDLINGALDRARKRGRNGRGAVVVVAAGNDQGPVRYPGSLPDVLTVGASNQWDERKTTASRDGETTWGSNHGPGIDLVAPGVQILTTDLTADAGTDRGSTTGRFSGTSAATPFAAAAAALVVSAAPHLDEAAVRAALVEGADSLGPRPRDRYVGAGRLNAFRALRAALRR